VVKKLQLKYKNIDYFPLTILVVVPKNLIRKKSKEEEQTLADLSSAHHHS